MKWSQLSLSAAAALAGGAHAGNEHLSRNNLGDQGRAKTLLPAIHPDTNVHDPGHLQPKHQHTLFFGEKDPHPDKNNTFAQLQLHFKHPTVALEHYAGIQGVKCHGSGNDTSIAITFKSSADVSTATGCWPQNSPFLLITNHDGCGSFEDGARSYHFTEGYRVNGNTITTGSCAERELINVINNGTISWGSHVPHNNRGWNGSTGPVRSNELKRRQDSDAPDPGAGADLASGPAPSGTPSGSDSGTSASGSTDGAGGGLGVNTFDEALDASEGEFFDASNASGDLLKNLLPGISLDALDDLTADEGTTHFMDTNVDGAANLAAAGVVNTDVPAANPTAAQPSATGAATASGAATGSAAAQPTASEEQPAQPTAVIPAGSQGQPDPAAAASTGSTDPASNGGVSQARRLRSRDMQAKLARRSQVGKFQKRGFWDLSELGRKWVEAVKSVVTFPVTFVSSVADFFENTSLDGIVGVLKNIKYEDLKKFAKGLLTGDLKLDVHDTWAISLPSESTISDKYKETPWDEEKFGKGYPIYGQDEDDEGSDNEGTEDSDSEKKDTDDSDSENEKRDGVEKSLKVWCQNCRVKGTLTVSGEVKFTSYKISAGHIDIKGPVELIFGLAIQAEISKEFEYEKTITSQNIGPFQIPKVAAIGFFVDLTVNFKTTFTAKGDLLVGGKWVWQEFGGHIDLVQANLKEPTKYFTCKTPTYTETLELKGSLTAEAEVGPALALKFGVKLLDSKALSASVGIVDAFSFEAEVTATKTLLTGDSEPADDDCALEASFGVRNRIYVAINVGTKQWEPKELRNDKLWGTKKCFSKTGKKGKTISGDDAEKPTGNVAARQAADPDAVSATATVTDAGTVTPAPATSDASDDGSDNSHLAATPGTPATDDAELAAADSLALKSVDTGLTKPMDVSDFKDNPDIESKLVPSSILTTDGKIALVPGNDGVVYAIDLQEAKKTANEVASWQAYGDLVYGDTLSRIMCVDTKSADNDFVSRVRMMPTNNLSTGMKLIGLKQAQGKPALFASDTQQNVYALTVCKVVPTGMTGEVNKLFGINTTKLTKVADGIAKLQDPEYERITGGKTTECQIVPWTLNQQPGSN